MKKIPLILAVIWMTGTAPSVFAAEAAPAAAGQTISVKTKGLVCDFCARSLEKMFKKRPEVQSFSVDLTTKDLKIGLKDGQSLDDAAVTKIVGDSGYNIEKIDRS